MKAFDLQVTGSLVVTGSIKTTDGTFILSGSDSNASSSFSSRITTNESNMTLATASIAALTASISRLNTEISTDDTDMNLATASIAAITSSISRLDNTESNMTLATASIAAITASVSTINDNMTLATASIALNESNMTLATASIAAITASVSTINDNMTLATASIAAITASLGQPVNTNSNVTFNDINSTGTITATEIHTTFVSSSITVASGSNTFGDDTSDSHQFTGSLSVSGSLTLNDGLLTVTDNVDFNGDLDVDGTANLDVVDIDGTLTVDGARSGDFLTKLTSTNQYGLYVKTTGTTSSHDLLKLDDNSGTVFKVMATGLVDIEGDLDVDGTTNLDVVDIDGAVDMASTLTTAANITVQANDPTTINAGEIAGDNDVLGINIKNTNTGNSTGGMLKFMSDNGDAMTAIAHNQAANTSGEMHFYTESSGTFAKRLILQAGGILETISGSAQAGGMSMKGGQVTYSTLGIHTGGTNTYTPASANHINTAITIDFPNANDSAGLIRFRSHGAMEGFFGYAQDGSDGQGDFVFQGYNGSAYAELMRITQEGKVGIGTTAPVTQLDVHSTGTEVAAAFGMADHGTAWITTRIEEAQNEYGALGFMVGTAAVDGVGSANCTSYIASTVENSGGTLQGSLKFYTNQGDSLQKRVQFYNGGEIDMSFHGDTSSGGTAALINSSGRMGTTTSLREAKGNIKKIDINATALMNKFEPVTFNYKKWDTKTGKYLDELEDSFEAGMIVNDTQDFGKDFNMYDEDGKVIGIRYQLLTPYLIKAVQELSEKIDSQQKEIEELKK